MQLFLPEKVHLELSYWKRQREREREKEKEKEKEGKEEERKRGEERVEGKGMNGLRIFFTSSSFSMR